MSFQEASAKSHVHMDPGDHIREILCRCNHVTLGDVPLALCSRGWETISETEDPKWHRLKGILKDPAKQAQEGRASLVIAASTLVPRVLLNCSNGPVWNNIPKANTHMGNKGNWISSSALCLGVRAYC